MSTTKSRVPVFFTLAQVAEFLQVSVKTVRRLVAAGALRTHRFGRQHRVDEDDLLAFASKSRR
jgi:excisionase family DNA binding protein